MYSSDFESRRPRPRPGVGVGGIHSEAGDWSAALHAGDLKSSAWREGNAIVGSLRSRRRRSRNRGRSRETMDRMRISMPVDVASVTSMTPELSTHLEFLVATLLPSRPLIGLIEAANPGCRACA